MSVVVDGCSNVTSLTHDNSSGTVFYGNVTCNGTETSLTDCQHGGFSPRDCQQSRAVSISCNVRKSAYFFYFTLRPCVCVWERERVLSYSYILLKMWMFLSKGEHHKILVANLNCFLNILFNKNSKHYKNNFLSSSGINTTLSEWKSLVRPPGNFLPRKMAIHVWWKLWAERGTGGLQDVWLWQVLCSQFYCFLLF